MSGGRISTGALGWIAAAATLAAAPPAPAQIEVALRRQASVAPGEPVRLGEVADLRGDGALALAGVVVDGAGAARRIDLDDVRRALRAREGVPWSRLVLRGGQCVLSPAAPGAAEPPAEAPPPAEPEAPPPGEGTVGALIGPSVARALGVPAEDLRLTFEAQDAAFLAQPAAGRTVEARPLGRAERVQCRVTVYEGDRIASSGLVRVGVRVRRQAAVLRGPVKRGAPLGEGDFQAQERWLAPGVEPADPARLVGSVARANLDAGREVLAEHVEAPLAVERGRIVSVHCVSGTVVVRMSGRALGDARVGEMVEVEHLDSTRREPRRFHARADGPGRVVVEGGPAPAGGR